MFAPCAAPLTTKTRRESAWKPRRSDSSSATCGRAASGSLCTPVHRLETAATTKLDERAALERILTELGYQPRFNARAVRQRAETFARLGLGWADAAHLAFAEAANAAFATVDDQLLRRATLVAASVWVGTPMGLCEREDLK